MCQPLNSLQRCVMVRQGPKWRVFSSPSGFKAGRVENLPCWKAHRSSKYLPCPSPTCRNSHALATYVLRRQQSTHNKSSLVRALSIRDHKRPDLSALWQTLGNSQESNCKGSLQTLKVFRKGEKVGKRRWWKLSRFSSVLTTTALAH